MAESSLVDYVKRGLKRKAFVTKHCDISPGIPDLSIYFPKADVFRWVETKASAQWPVRAETRIWWDHYTEQQALWLYQRRGFLFVRVSKSYALFDGKTAWEMWEARGFTKRVFVDSARKVWFGNVSWLEFAEELATK